MARVIKELDLDEISFVDRPAQEGATSRILKAKSVSSGDMVSWNSSGGVARGKVERVATSGKINVPNSSFEINASEDDPAALIRVYRNGEPTDTLVGHKVSTLRKSADDDLEDTIRKTIAEVEASKSAGDHPSEEEQSMSDETAKVAELESKLADLQKSLEAAEVAKADAEAVSKMSDAEKAYMDGLSEDERKAFMGMKPDERKRRMAKAAEADETVEVEGESIAKSKVGAEVFAVMKAQAARIEAVEKQAAADREAAQMADLRKRADDEFNALPGSADDRANVLKALDAIECEDTRNAAYAILKAAQEHAKGGLVTKGVSDGQVSKSKTDFDAKVTELAKSMPRHEALSKAREKFPAEYEAAYGAN